MWLRSPERYVRQYIHGAGGFTNSGMEYGSKISRALESGQDDGDGMVEALLALLPRYSLSEHEIRVPYKTQHGTVELLGRLDTFDPKAVRFREYKTGRVAWTQAKAEKHKQLPHYAAMVWLFHGKLPTEIWLDWVETEEVDGEVKMTGRIESFRVKLGMGEILQHLALVSRVAKQIDAAYRAEMSKLT